MRTLEPASLKLSRSFNSCSHSQVIQHIQDELESRLFLSRLIKDVGELGHGGYCFDLGCAALATYNEKPYFLSALHCLFKDCSHNGFRSRVSKKQKLFAKFLDREIEVNPQIFKRKWWHPLGHDYIPDIAFALAPLDSITDLTIDPKCSIEIGDRVFAYGFPGGFFEKTNGTITELSGGQIIHSCFTEGGSSGGPLIKFDKNNKKILIGINIASCDPKSLSDGSLLVRSYAVSIHKLLESMKDFAAIE